METGTIQISRKFFCKINFHRRLTIKIISRSFTRIQRVSALLALVALVNSIALALIPVAVAPSTLKYGAADLHQVKPVLLSADVPSELRVDFQDLANVPDGVLLSTSNVAASYSIGASKHDGKILFGFFHPAVNDSNPALVHSIDMSTLGACQTSLLFKAASLSLECGTKSIFSLKFPDSILGPILTHLYSPFGAVELVTEPSVVVQPPQRQLSQLLIVLIVIASATLWVLSKRRGNSKGVSRSPALTRTNGWRSELQILTSNLGGKISATILHVVMGVFLVTIAIIAWPIDDDGNVLGTATALPDVGSLSNYFSLSAAFQPTGNLPYVLLAPWWGFVHNLMLMRLPVLLATYVAWIFLYKTILILVPAGRARVMPLIAGATFFGFFAFGFATLRPEPFVALTLSIGIWLAVRIINNHDKSLIVHLGGVAGLAIVIHQTGLVVIGLFAAVLFTQFTLSNLGSMIRAQIVPILLWLTALFLITFYFVDASTLLAWSQQFASAGSHSQPIIEEFNRYMSTLSQVDIRAFSVLWLILSLVTVPLLAIGAKVPVSIRTTIIAFVIALFSLAFTASKWMWHFGAVAPLGGILGALLVYLMMKNSVKTAILVSSIFVLPTISLATFSAGRAWLGTLPGIPSPDFAAEYAMRGDVLAGAWFPHAARHIPLILCLVGMIAVVLVWGILRHRNSLKALAVVVIPCYLLGTAVAITLVASLPVDSGFSPARMNLAVLTGQDTCGSLGTTTLDLPGAVVGPSLFTNMGANTLTTASADMPEVHLLNTALSVKQMTVTNPTFHSLVATLTLTEGSNELTPGTLIYLKSIDDTQIVLQSGSPAAPNAASIALRNDLWLPFIVPPQGASAFVSFTLKEGTAASFLATEFMSTDSRPATTYFAEHNINRAVLDPQLALFTPCLRSPGIQNGTFPNESYAVSDPAYADLGQEKRLDVGNKYLVENDTFQLGCPLVKKGHLDSWIGGALCVYALTPQS